MLQTTSKITWWQINKLISKNKHKDKNTFHEQTGKRSLSNRQYFHS